MPVLNIFNDLQILLYTLYTFSYRVLEMKEGGTCI